MNTDKDQAREALDLAREAHAAAMLAKIEAPEDPGTQQMLRNAVQQGRGAWKGYQTAATAGLAAQIDEIVPSVFRED